ELPQLYKGCKGEPVRVLQAILMERGYSCGASGADGSFGPATDKAVKAFQRDCELEADGYVGRDTMGALLGL
ncbi:MAG: peptidoglycan-binding protein, partial [Oscillospiraceae bacterium]|nr:peptidoglycan-binding protein [Oscillospiraceae bacterium]